jgi:hypothetical protein
VNADGNNIACYENAHKFRAVISSNYFTPEISSDKRINLDYSAYWCTA